MPGSFALAEDHLRKALADAPVVIDAREPEVFEGAVAQKLKESHLSGLRRYTTSVDRLEQGHELSSVHGAKSLTGVDFRLN